MNKSQHFTLYLLGVLLLATAVFLVTLITAREPDVVILDFKLPHFEEGVVLGVPEEITASPDYREGSVDGSFSFSIDATPAYEDQYLYTYFSSDADNEVWLLIKVYDTNGEELGKSGLIRQGECIPALKLSRAPDGQEIEVKMYSYEPDTYFSRGSASARLLIKEG